MKRKSLRYAKANVHNNNYCCVMNKLATTRQLTDAQHARKIELAVAAISMLPSSSFLMLTVPLAAKYSRIVSHLSF